MARNYVRDYKELLKFTKEWKNKLTGDCIEAYAKKRKIVIHRAGKVFWNLVDNGEIKVYQDGLFYYIEE